ncbi:conserved hypothetical protein [Heliomicrobium modesticaldum Ice1]|uniref:Uncharacterized protein n=1 Tax=Heliobacterium modesticaldum (strain ATCC 51547 / Ice1) TaxID=498761 RepID=B0TDZ1_HELMI|nr:DUF3006 domain-containing protein [Heliomicrobium modesticaldum]ABZ82854.1 conserved hypothetical protein [Heliomicrobium modesticaldum Ice1]
MALIIDRFEGQFAVVEVDGKGTIDIPRKELPVQTREGDVIRLINGRYEIDLAETKRLRAEANKRTDDFWS